MPLTREELDQFHEYAAARIENGGAGSIEECLHTWRVAREEDETLASIRRGLEQAEAGQLRPFHEVDAEIRAKYGISLDE